MSTPLRTPIVKKQFPSVLGPATATAVAPGASVVIASEKAPLEMDAFLVYYGMSIGTVANQNFATFIVRVNGVPFRSDATQFGSLNQPTRLPQPQKLGQGCLVELVGQMAAGAAGNTDMAAVAGLVYVTPGMQPDV